MVACTTRRLAARATRIVDLLRIHREKTELGEELVRYLDGDAKLIGRLRQHGACSAIRRALTVAEQLFILRLQICAVELQLAGADRDGWVSELIAYSTELRLENYA